MKLLLVGLLTVVASGPANDQPEMMLVPRESAEALVKENLERQQNEDTLLQMLREQGKRIQQLQSSSNCV